MTAKGGEQARFHPTEPVNYYEGVMDSFEAAGDNGSSRDNLATTYHRLLELATAPDDNSEAVREAHELRRVLILRCLVELAIREDECESLLVKSVGSDNGLEQSEGRTDYDAFCQTREEIRRLYDIESNKISLAKEAALKRSID